MSNKLTIIVPIHKVDLNEAYLINMFDSISKQDSKNFDVIVATFPKLQAEINAANTFDVQFSFLDLPEELENVYPNYTEIVNFAVHSVNTEFFTVLEYDDVINNTFVTYVDQYSNAYPNVSVFLPITLEFDGENFIRTANEVAWSLNYTEKQGYLDFETLKKLPIFSFVSAVYKTEEFIANNGFKHSIKKYFDYEYFLRILNQLSEVMVIPKFMVRHTVNRENSLSAYYDAQDKLEMKFYLDLAKKEYYFPEDRQITYEG